MSNLKMVHYIYFELLGSNGEYKFEICQSFYPKLITK